MIENDLREYRIRNNKQAIECEIIGEDAIMRNGKFDGIKLSDIYIFFPGYLNSLVNNKNANNDLRYIAKRIIEDSEEFSESISREIALK